MTTGNTLRQAARRAGLITGNGPLAYLPKDMRQQVVCPLSLIRDFGSSSRRSEAGERGLKEGRLRGQSLSGTNTRSIRRDYSAEATTGSGPPKTADQPNFSHQFRTVMRTLTSPVVVCTTTSTASSSHRAMTMSSFTSLSPQSPPLIMFNIQEPSRTADAIAETGTFNIHILSGNEQGQALAAYFTKGNANTLLGEGRGPRIKEGVTPPVLEDGGVLWVLRCRLAPREGRDCDFIRVRDHNIVVGEVMEMIEGPREHAGEPAMGLGYADRKYRRIGNEIPSKS